MVISTKTEGKIRGKKLLRHGSRCHSRTRANITCLLVEFDAGCCCPCPFWGPRPRGTIPWSWGILHVAAAASCRSWGILRVLQVSTWESMLASSVAKLLPLLKAISWNAQDAKSCRIAKKNTRNLYSSYFCLANSYRLASPVPCASTGLENPQGILQNDI